MQYQELEQEYKRRVSPEHRKKYAQFFTPEPVARVMAQWLSENPKLRTILDPSFGLGALLQPFINKENICLDGYDIDDTILKYASDHEFTKNVTLKHQDYIASDWAQSYDGIICNPPYFKFHDYDNKSYIPELEKHLKCKLSGFTNLYTLFLLKSIHQLNEGGRCSFIVPSEFLNADYGVQVKDLLLKSNKLRHIVVIDFKEKLFDEALTTACIVLCANDDNCKTVRFSYVKTLAELESAHKNFIELPREELDCKIKWKAYYSKPRRCKYKHLVPFRKYAKVMRGIATGDNNYFAFSASKARKYNLTEQQLIRCVCKSADVQAPVFTNEQFEELKQEDKKVYLFNACADIENESVQNYIKAGEIAKTNERYLTSQRTPWYALENRPPAPIWVTVFNRNGLRFVRNEANVYNLTTFHCIYPMQNDLFNQIDEDLLFVYLQTNFAKDILLENCREYGNGLVKFEPNDINNGMMADLEQLSPDEKKHIKGLYREYCQTQNCALLDDIEQLFQKEYIA